MRLYGLGCVGSQATTHSNNLNKTLVLQLSEYNGAWQFEAKDGFGVSDADREQIQPLDESESAKIWDQEISANFRHPMRLPETEWSQLFGTSLHRCDSKFEWQTYWESDSNEFPSELLRSLQWNKKQTVFFAYNRSDVIQTNWEVFQRTWKSFLLEDEGPLLFSPESPEIISFEPNGHFKIGRRTKRLQ